MVEVFKFREIQAFFTARLPDSADSDQLPDRVPLNGYGTLRPNIRGASVVFTEVGEFAVPRTRQVAIVDGELLVEVIDGESSILQPLFLEVTVDERANQQWSWTLTFDSLTIGERGEEISHPALSFPVEDGDGPLELSTVATTVTRTANFVTRGPRGYRVTEVSAANGELVFAWEDGRTDNVPIPEAVQGVGVDDAIQPTGGSMALRLTDGSTTTPVSLPPGPRGLDGSNVLPTDEAVAQAVSESTTDTRGALEGLFVARNITRTVHDGEVLHIVDDAPGPSSNTFRLEDTAEHGGSIINIHHRSDGSGSAQTYGINLANHVGASTAFAIHQYSRRVAVQIDNTDAGSSIYIKNTQNQTMNPGGQGTGPFLQFLPFGESSTVMLTDSLTWFNNTSKDMNVRANNPTNYAFGVSTPANKVGLQVEKTGTGAGNAMSVDNYGAGMGIWINQRGPGSGLFINADYEETWGKPATRVFGSTHGGEYATSGNGGQALLVQKFGTGNGWGIQIRNHGTGPAIVAKNGNGDDMWRVNADGEMEVKTPGAGLILNAPDGSRHRLTVTNAGQLAVAPA